MELHDQAEAVAEIVAVIVRGILSATPLAVVACVALSLLTLPVAAIRCGILLRALGASIPFVDLLHFVSIGVLTNVLLLGGPGGDALRGIYAWRALGRSGGRIACRCLPIGCLPCSLSCSHSLAFSLPALAALGTSIIAAAAACAIGAGMVLAAPGLTRPLEVWLLRWPTAARLLVQVRGVILMLRTSSPSLLAAFALALVTQILTVFAVLVLAQAIKIGVLSAADYMFAVPLTLIVNALPLTPGGIGVGGAAFDQICRWPEPTPSGAAYSSIFFAFRVVSTLTCIPGPISLAIYHNSARSGPTS